MVSGLASHRTYPLSFDNGESTRLLTYLHVKWLMRRSRSQLLGAPASRRPRGRQAQLPVKLGVGRCRAFITGLS